MQPCTNKSIPVSVSQFGIATLALIAFSALGLADEDAVKVTFDDHVKPILREHCATCHSESDKESDLALDSYSGALAGGSSGEVLGKGNLSASRLWALITHAERPFMPPDSDPIPEAQRNLIKAWIEQGMPENAGSKIRRASGAASQMLAGGSIGKPEGPPPMPENMLRQPIIVTQRSAAISAMTASPWAPLVAIGGQQQVSLYHSQSGDLLGIIPFPEGVPQSLSFTRDGKQLLIGGGQHSRSGVAVLVDVASGHRISKVGDEMDIVLAADITPDKSRIALAGPQRIVRVFDTLSGELVFEMKKHTDWIFALRYSPDGVLLASGDRSNGLVVWEADSGRLYADLIGHRDSVRSLDFRSDSNVLASGSLDGTIKLWDMYESKEIKSWNAHGGGVTAVAFSHDATLASAGNDRQIKLWNPAGELIKEFPGLSDAALEVALTGDAAHVAGGDWNGNAQLWQTADPGQSKLIYANPVSVEQRIKDVSAELAAVESEFQSVSQVAQIDAANAEQAQENWQAAQQAATAAVMELQSVSQTEQDLAAKQAEQDQRLMELEQQLLALKSARAAVVEQLSGTRKAVQELSQRSQTAEEALAAAQTKHQQLSEAAQKSAATKLEIEAKLAAARERSARALADKAALDAAAENLRKQTDSTSARAQELAVQVAEAADVSKQHKSVLDKLTDEMKALSEQLAVLQQRVEQAVMSQAEANRQLGSQNENVQRLQAELESAEQAALEAKERFELFQRAYRLQ